MKNPAFLLVGALVAITIAFTAWFIPFTLSFDRSEKAFKVGAAHYQSGRFEEALEAMRHGQWASSGSKHNLGNTHYQLDHLGAAVLAWERARALDPAFRNTAANLRFARGVAGLDEPQFLWTEKYSALLTPDAWLWLATAAFWAAVALLALPALLRWKRNAWTQGGAVLALALLLCTLPALAGLWSRAALGVVLAKDPDLRLTPTREGEVLGRLSAGELARVEKSRGEYAYVRAASDRAGWVRWDEFAKIWP